MLVGRTLAGSTNRHLSSVRARRAASSSTARSTRCASPTPAMHGRRSPPPTPPRTRRRALRRRRRATWSWRWARGTTRRASSSRRRRPTPTTRHLVALRREEGIGRQLHQHRGLVRHRWCLLRLAGVHDSHDQRDRRCDRVPLASAPERRRRGVLDMGAVRGERGVGAGLRRRRDTDRGMARDGNAPSY